MSVSLIGRRHAFFLFEKTFEGWGKRITERIFHLKLGALGSRPDFSKSSALPVRNDRRTAARETNNIAWIIPSSDSASFPNPNYKSLICPRQLQILAEAGGVCYSDILSHPWTCYCFQKYNKPEKDISV